MTSRLADLLEIAEAIEHFGDVTDPDNPKPYSGPNRAIQLLREAVREQSARRSKAAAGPRKAAVTREQLEAFRDDWRARSGSLRGWVKAASFAFNLTEKTIFLRMTKE